MLFRSAALLNLHLGAGMSSLLFQEIREKRGLAYTVFSNVVPFDDSGIFAIYAATAPESDLVLAVLSMVDLIMVANLVVMVIISGYENFVSHIDTEGKSDRLSWFGKLDAGSLKIKLASSIVAISSIHLLQRFLEAGDFENAKLYALVVMHMAFVVSALMLTYIDKIASSKPGGH